MSNGQVAFTRERFVIGSVTGYSINPKAASVPWGDRPPPTIWYVYDRAYCDRVVAIFHNTGGLIRPRQRALLRARELNVKDRRDDRG